MTQKITIHISLESKSFDSFDSKNLFVCKIYIYCLVLDKIN